MKRIIGEINGGGYLRGLCRRGCAPAMFLVCRVTRAALRNLSKDCGTRKVNNAVSRDKRECRSATRDNRDASRGMIMQVSRQGNAKAEGYMPLLPAP